MEDKTSVKLILVSSVLHMIALVRSIMCLLYHVLIVENEKVKVWQAQVDSQLACVFTRIRRHHQSYYLKIPSTHSILRLSSRVHRGTSSRKFIEGARCQQERVFVSAHVVWVAHMSLCWHSSRVGICRT